MKKAFNVQEKTMKSRRGAGNGINLDAFAGSSCYGVGG
jgi:hypothetical protein